MKNKVLETTLVTIQFITAGYLVLKADWSTMPVLLLLLVIMSGALAVWSIGVMKLGNLRVVPTPLDSATLRVNGPYRLIRHPMYTSLILLSIPLIVQHPEPVRIVMGILLVSDLIVKLYYEERLLKEKFPEYTAYMGRTKRLIPFIY
jgi:protein-S-isoprenylcysteine O-methyltransferase Ste14